MRDRPHVASAAVALRGPDRLHEPRCRSLSRAEPRGRRTRLPSRRGLAVICLAALLAAFATAASAGDYKGRYCEGGGDVEFLQLIDRSFGFFHPTPENQNISMLYVPDHDVLCEGPAWGVAWWIQNSYGPTYCALPFLQEPWLTALQHSQDLWFNQQGDGKTKDSFDSIRPAGVPELIAPDGCLVDCATPTGSYHRQGDCKWWIHDWGLEFTAAGVVMQAEILLIGRDLRAIRKYLPNLERACDFLDTVRDPKNGLFLSGPAGNLLAPSYGGVRQPDGTFGKGYLAGLSITHLAAMDRMVELYRLVGDKAKLADYQNRCEVTRSSLPQLLTKDGYFVKSIDPDGTRHGVLGQEKFGYFEAVTNVDAIAFRAVDDSAADRIYWRIASIPELRPYDFIITNWPGLDDIYDHWGTRECGGLWTYGMWVNGGVWSTLEARAIMGYYRLGKFEDVRRSAKRSMQFADEFQLDAPLKDFGKTPWFDTKLTNLCYDALGVPAATCRGLFEYIYRADSLELYPHIPPSIEEYHQHEPIRFGEKRITLSVTSNGPRVRSVMVNGEQWPVAASDHVSLPYDRLPAKARVEMVMSGGRAPYGKATAAAERAEPPATPADLPESMTKPYAVLAGMWKLLEKERGADYERAFVSEALAAFDAYRTRAARDAAGDFAAMKQEKRAEILKLYEDAAMNLYKGFDNEIGRAHV